MRKYGESKTTRIMMATVRHVTSSSGLRKFQADEFLLDGVYVEKLSVVVRLSATRPTQEPCQAGVLKNSHVGCSGSCAPVLNIRLQHLLVYSRTLRRSASHACQQLSSQIKQG